MLKIKKKKTSGYAIFCSEQRRQYASAQPDLQFSDISKKVMCSSSYQRISVDRPEASSYARYFWDESMFE